MSSYKPITYNRSIGYLSSLTNRSTSSLYIPRRHTISVPSTPVREKPLPVGNNSSMEGGNVGKRRKYRAKCCMCMSLGAGVRTICYSWILISLVGFVMLIPLNPIHNTASLPPSNVSNSYASDGFFGLIYLATYQFLKLALACFGLLAVWTRKMLRLKRFTTLFVTADSLMTLANTIFYTWVVMKRDALPNIGFIGTCYDSVETCFKSGSFSQAIKPTYTIVVLVLAWIVFIYQIISAYYILVYYRSVQRGISISNEKMSRSASVTLLPKGTITVQMPQTMQRAKTKEEKSRSHSSSNARAGTITEQQSNILHDIKL